MEGQRKAMKEVVKEAKVKDRVRVKLASQSFKATS